jgi:hypothetical protein
VAGWILLRGGAQRGEVVKLIINFADEETVVGPAPQLAPQAASVQITEGSVASVVKLADPFISKTAGD